MPPEPPSALTYQCVSCSYDLRGASGRRCPECGQLLTAAAIATAREHSLFRRLARGAAVALVLLIAIGIPVLALMREHALVLVPLLVLLIAPAAPVILASYASRKL